MCQPAGFSDDLRNVFEKDYVASKPHLAVSDETLPEPASVSPTREAEVEINPVSPIPDSTNPDSTVQLSPAQQTEDVLDSAGPRPAHAESVATEAQSPRTFDNDDMGIEHLRDGGFPVYMPSPPPRSSPFRTDDFTTQSGNWETESYRTEPSTSTVPEDLPGQRNLGLSPVSERTDEVCSRMFACFVFTILGALLTLIAIPFACAIQELYFLEVGGNSPVGTPASQDSAALTGRARYIYS